MIALYIILYLICGILWLKFVDENYGGAAHMVAHQIPWAGMCMLIFGIVCWPLLIVNYIARTISEYIQNKRNPLE